MSSLFDPQRILSASQSSKPPLTPRLIRKREELGAVLMHSPFLSAGEKTKIIEILPIFSIEILDAIRDSLLRENLRTLMKKSSQ